MNSITKPDPENSINRAIKRAILDSRQETLNWLVVDHEFNEEDAIEIEAQIANTVIARMKDTFSFRTGPRTFQLGFLAEQLEPAIPDHSDFVNWTFTAASILIYQSIGDTIGYYNGKWEFNHGNPYESPEYVNELLYEYIHLGGINDMDTHGWLASDDTVLYMATFDTLLSGFSTIDQYGQRLRRSYLQALPSIVDRDPGITTIESLREQRKFKSWTMLPYNPKALGNGSAMRSGSIGILLPGSTNRPQLIALATETSRLTHNSASAILGSITSALFTSLAIEREPINIWPRKLLELIDSDLIDGYLQQSRPQEYDLYVRDRVLFTGQWRKYLDLLFVGGKPRLDIKIMVNAVQRFKYLSDNFSKDCDIPGGCAHDALIMAYDALVRCNGSIEKLLVYSILHPGDSDTVGSIAFSWFAAYYDSPYNETVMAHFRSNLEFKDEIEDLTKLSVLPLVGAYYRGIYSGYADEAIQQYVAQKKG
ncbi:ADP-ribosylglycohydrolase [uncultured virus]|nr:ADP-ribosylglycohydrolase [uncultured virus]